MEIPDASTLRPLIESASWPPFVRVTYRPPTPRLDDPASAARAAVADLDLSLPAGANVGVAVGSRGIHAIDTIAAETVEAIDAEGYTPVILPAMGSHGGATAAGQRAVLEELGITPETMGCPIDARMDTRVVGTVVVDGIEVDVHVATAALEVDAVVPVNRVKPHTGFAGPVESGLCKMLVIGLGKQPGARTAHQTVIRSGFEAYLEAVLPVLREAITVPGGVAILENFEDETAAIHGIPGQELITRETAILREAIDLMPTLPVNDLDILVVDELGKNVSGTGMDTNVIGRSDITQQPSIAGPDITRIYVRALTAETHGNANGVGLADVVHRDVFDAVDLEQTYANVITSGATSNAAMPMVMPTDDTALGVLRGSLGTIDSNELRMAWIHETGDLETIRLSAPIVEDLDTAGITIQGRERLTFSDGHATFESIE